MNTDADSIAPAAKSKDLVVFSIIRNSACSECRREVWKGELLFMEAGRPLCLDCADLDHLVYLPRGDAALTRRARKHSPLSAVVVRFSRSRKRYEREGVLVSEEALDRAEEECLADGELRARRRERDEERRVESDRDLVVRMTDAISGLFPGCPVEEARTIAAHTARPGSGRVGRTLAGRSLDEGALTAAVVAAVRHRHTRYDELFMRGYSRCDARASIREAVERVLKSWRKPTRPR